LIAAAFFLFTVIFIVVCIASHSPNPVFLVRDPNFYNKKENFAKKFTTEIKLEVEGVIKTS
jgi:hypothetical protein